jgi:hypothetical protein
MNSIHKGFYSLFAVLATIIMAFLIVGASAANWVFAVNNMWNIYATYYNLPQLPFAIFFGVSCLLSIFTVGRTANNLYAIWCELIDNQTEEQIKRNENSSIICNFLAPWVIVGLLHVYLFFCPIKPIAWPASGTTANATQVEEALPTAHGDK